MNTIAILPEQGGEQPTTFSAVVANRVATGRTAGEALDALTSQLSADEAAAPVIVQQLRPDNFFTDEQRDRLSALMVRWRAAREGGRALPQAEQSELERLVDEEVEGTAERAAHISPDIERARSGFKNQQRRRLVWLRAAMWHPLWRIIPRFFLLSLSLMAADAMLDALVSLLGGGAALGGANHAVVKGLLTLAWFAVCLDLALELGEWLFGRFERRKR